MQVNKVNNHNQAFSGLMMVHGTNINYTKAQAKIAKVLSEIINSNSSVTNDLLEVLGKSPVKKDIVYAPHGKTKMVMELVVPSFLKGKHTPMDSSNEPIRVFFKKGCNITKRLEEFLVKCLEYTHDTAQQNQFAKSEINALNQIRKFGLEADNFEPLRPTLLIRGKNNIEDHYQNCLIKQLQEEGLFL